MQLSIIIINYNTFKLTCNCIASIQDKLVGIAYEIVLVDNASTECDPNLFLEKFPAINLVKSTVNTGFAGGNNLGLAVATGTYILLLNSDTELINNAPKICYDYIVANPKVGMVTAQLQYPNGQLQHSCRRFRTISWELLEVFPIYKLLPKQKREALMLHTYFDHTTTMNCDWVWGTFMLFSKSIVQQLPKNKLSDDFFMYSEDTLWCLEFKQLGYLIHYLPQAKVMHIHKGSSSSNKWLQIRKIGIKNHAQVMKKYYPDFRWYIFAAIYYTKQYAALWWHQIKLAIQKA
jgi:GT2 family glycosyltransferase